MASSGFPESSVLWPGCILGSIVHAVMMTRYPDLANEQSWDGANYCIQDSMGSRGTISFSGADFVGVLFDKESARNPLRSDRDYDVNRFLKGIPPHLERLAHDEALQYVLDNYRGKVIPIITAAFWSEGTRMAAAEPWNEVFVNGARLLKLQLIDTRVALEQWRTDYEMSASQTQLVRALFERKIALPNATVEMSDTERETLLRAAQSPEGKKETLASLAEIGIY